LLEELNGASDEQSSTRADPVFLEQVFPGTGSDGSLQLDCVLNFLVLGEHVVVGGGLVLNPRDYGERLLGASVRGQPSGRLGHDEDENEHGDDEDCLESDGNTPSLGSGHGSEAVSDPVGDEDAEVEQRELEADKASTSPGRGHLGLQNWDGRVDESLHSAVVSISYHPPFRGLKQSLHRSSLQQS
jgi:hypothetical protein